jgi:hypothetical protein
LLLKVTCRDARGVVVTVIADNYFGYCKKEVKTQLGMAANLYGQTEVRITLFFLLCAIIPTPELPSIVISSFQSSSGFTHFRISNPVER